MKKMSHDEIAAFIAVIYCAENMTTILTMRKFTKLFEDEKVIEMAFATQERSIAKGLEEDECIMAGFAPADR